MPNIDFTSPIVMVIIAIVLIAAVYFGYKLLFSTISSTSTSPVPELDTPKIDDAVAASGVKTSNDGVNMGVTASATTTRSGAEHFTDIVFDSLDKINKNFVEYCRIFLPSLNIDEIQKILKENGENDSIQTIINNNNVDVIKHLFNGYILLYLILIGYSSDKTNKILTGLLFFNINNIMMNKFSANTNNTYYYFNDYEKFNEFFIYIIPNNYTFDVATITTDKTVTEVTSDGFFGEITKPVKFSLDKFLKSTIKTMIFERNNIVPISVVSTTSANNNTSSVRFTYAEEDYNKFYDVMNKHSDVLHKFISYNIAGLLLGVNKKVTITKDTKLLIQMVDLMLDDTQITAELQKYTGPVKPDRINTREQLLELLRSSMINTILQEQQQQQQQSTLISEAAITNIDSPNDKIIVKYSNNAIIAYNLAAAPDSSLPNTLLTIPKINIDNLINSFELPATNIKTYDVELSELSRPTISTFVYSAPVGEIVFDNPESIGIISVRKSSIQSRV